MEMLAIYILILGIILAAVGALEAIAPLKAFGFWKEWVSKKLFFLHGPLLIIGGFPLTIYKGPLSTALFIFGLLAVLMGPFILIYPEKIRATFQAMAEEMQNADIKKIIRAEAFLRLGAGAVCIASYLMQM